MRRLRFVLQGSALALAAAGVVFSILPASADVAQQTAAIPSMSPGDSLMLLPSAHVDSLGEEIVLANIFARSRTAPLARYTPPDIAGDTASGMLPDPVMSDSAALAFGFTPRLLGTVVGGESSGTPSRALLQLDAIDPTPRLYGIGDRAGGYRVISIAPREVVLAGPGGRLVLRLTDKEERP